MIGTALFIVLNVLILVIFRLYKRYNVNTFQAVVVNYFVCTGIGIATNSFSEYNQLISFQSNWFLIIMGLGGLFVLTFYVMARSVQEAGFNITTISGKMSLVIPVLLNLFIFGTSNYNWLNYLGILLALTSIVLVSYKGKSISKTSLLSSHIKYPLSLFFLGGIIDSTMSYLNIYYEEKQHYVAFFTFGSASLFGCLIVLYRTFFLKNRFPLKSLVGGLVLGSINYYSIYTIFIALSAFHNDGGVAFPVFSIGIILLSNFVAMLFFREHLSGVNKFGIGLAILAIGLVSYQKLLF